METIFVKLFAWFLIINCGIYTKYWYRTTYPHRYYEVTKHSYTPPYLTPKPHWYLYETVKGVRREKKHQATLIKGDENLLGYRISPSRIETRRINNEIIRTNYYECRKCLFFDDNEKRFVNYGNQGIICIDCYKIIHNILTSNYEKTLFKTTNVVGR